MIVSVFSTFLFASFGFANKPVILYREYTALYLSYIHHQTEVDRYHHSSYNISHSALCKHTALWIGKYNHARLNDNKNIKNI